MAGREHARERQTRASRDVFSRSLNKVARARSDEGSGRANGNVPDSAEPGTVLRDGGISKLITGVGAQMRLQTLLTREHPAAVLALDVTRRRASLHHEIRESVGARPTATVALEPGAFPVTPGSDATARAHAVLPVFRRGTRAARTKIHARLLAPVPRVERVAGTALQSLRRRPRLPFRRAQFHVALALVFALTFSLSHSVQRRHLFHRADSCSLTSGITALDRLADTSDLFAAARGTRAACNVQLVNRQNTHVYARPREPEEMADACARIHHGSFNRVRESRVDRASERATREMTPREKRLSRFISS